MNKVGMDCKDAVKRVYDYLDGELDAETAEQIRRHIEICKRCYPYFNFERIFLDHIRSKGARGARSKELEEKVLAMLRAMD
ncbi:MAG: zf-HC2 domain-containing protein [Gemmatimonadota bacterium]